MPRLVTEFTISMMIETRGSCRIGDENRLSWDAKMQGILFLPPAPCHTTPGASNTPDNHPPPRPPPGLQADSSCTRLSLMTTSKC